MVRKDIAMSNDGSHETSAGSHSALLPKTLLTLERLDNVAHVFVAAFFILMAATVLVYSLAIFMRQMPLIGAAFHPHAAISAVDKSKPNVETPKSGGTNSSAA